MSISAVNGAAQDPLPQEDGPQGLHRSLPRHPSDQELDAQGAKTGPGHGHHHGGGGSHSVTSSPAIAASAAGAVPQHDRDVAAASACLTDTSVIEGAIVVGDLLRPDGSGRPGGTDRPTLWLWNASSARSTSHPACRPRH